MEMEYVNLKLSQEFRCYSRRLFLLLRQRKFVFAFRALSHSALYKRWTTRTSKCSTIRYVEGETAFGTFHCTFRLRTHFLSLSQNKPLREILKTFLEILKRFDAEISTTSKTIKYCDSEVFVKNKSVWE